MNYKYSHYSHLWYYDCSHRKQDKGRGDEEGDVRQRVRKAHKQVEGERLQHLQEEIDRHGTLDNHIESAGTRLLPALHRNVNRAR